MTIHILDTYAVRGYTTHLCVDTSDGTLAEITAQQINDARWDATYGHLDPTQIDRLWPGVQWHADEKNAYAQVTHTHRAIDRAQTAPGAFDPSVARFVAVHSDCATGESTELHTSTDERPLTVPSGLRTLDPGTAPDILREAVARARHTARRTIGRVSAYG